MTIGQVSHNIIFGKGVVTFMMGITHKDSFESSIKSLGDAGIGVYDYAYIYARCHLEIIKIEENPRSFLSFSMLYPPTDFSMSSKACFRPL